MAIKSEVVGTEPREKYPYIGVGRDGLIVLFSEKETGFVLRSATTYPHKVGHRSSAWAEESFEPLAGSITLSNE